EIDKPRGSRPRRAGCHLAKLFPAQGKIGRRHDELAENGTLVAQVHEAGAVASEVEILERLPEIGIERGPQIAHVSTLLSHEAIGRPCPITLCRRRAIRFWLRSYSPK